MSATLLLIGTGFVGGSFARAAKARGLFDRVLGMDRDPRTLAEAVQLGIVDAPAESFVGHAAVCVAVPVGGIAERVREAVVGGAPVFDVGSVKEAVVDALRPVPANFVPCHPIAGSERHGPAAARADLFENRVTILTPVAATDPAAVSTVRGYWEALGARVVVESPTAHDERFAVVSHLPHLLAFAFMEVASRAVPLDVAGDGFRDFVRIAGSDPDVWVDILRANASRVRPRLEEVIRELRAYSAILDLDRSALRERIGNVVQAQRSFDLADR